MDVILQLNYIYRLLFVVSYSFRIQHTQSYPAQSENVNATEYATAYVNYTRIRSESKENRVRKYSFLTIREIKTRVERRTYLYTIYDKYTFQSTFYILRNTTRK